MIEVKLLKKSGQAAVVSFWDNETGMMQAHIISMNDLPNDLRVGQTANVSDDALLTGTEYGMEWELLLSQSESLMVLTASLRNHGIWTLEDLNNNPRQCIAAINSASVRIYAELLQLVKDL